MVKSDKIGEDDSDGIFHIFKNILRFLPFKLAIIMFFVYLIISSDVFTGRILSGFEGAVGYSGIVTDKGTVILGIILMLSIFATDFLIKINLI